MDLEIIGMGTVVPQYHMTQEEGYEFVRPFCCTKPKQERVLSTLVQRSGISKRHTVLGNSNGANGNLYPSPTHAPHGPTTGQRMQQYRAEALPLAAESARLALEDSKTQVDQITHLITVSCSGFSAPGYEIGLIKSLGLRTTVQRTNIGFMGCHGALNGLQVARSIVRSESESRVLLCAVELCTLHLQYGWEPDRIVASILFSDGAAALVGIPSQELHERAWNLVSAASDIIPDSEEDMTWQIGDHGFEMTLSARVPGLIAQHLRHSIEEWLNQEGLTIQDIGSWAIHPGGIRILDAVQQSLDLTREDVATSHYILNQHGNMSSPTILFIVERLRAQRSKLPCVALGFGPGLVLEAVLFM